MISNETILSIISGVNHSLESLNDEFGARDVYLSYLPLQNIFDRVLEELLISTGASIGFLQGDIKLLIEDIKELKPTVRCAVPRILDRIYTGVIENTSSAGLIKQALFNIAYSYALKEFEREKKARILLEDLCDEFAKGIRDYEQEVRSLKHKPEKECAHRESPDRLILHLSEAWIDERMQMKLTEPQYDLTEKNTIVDKLSLEIETFLRAKHSVGSVNKNGLRRHSLESFHLNGATSAPHNIDDEEDFTSSDSNCFELNRASNGKQSNGISKHNGNDASESHLKEVKPNPKQKKKALSREILKGQQGSQMQFEYGENGTKDPGEVSSSLKLEMSEVTKALGDKKNKRIGNGGSNSNHMLSNLIENHSFLFEGGKLHADNKLKDDSCAWSALPGHASPVQPWKSRFTAPDIEVSETSSRWPQGLKEHTLKAKLLEARLEGQRSHSRESKGAS
ncbi:AMP-dependent synthetase and ligase family protein [Actinidia rufa]|uniref:AMP-dependent synthetase and ligase family protein n=1 Tax=Actinidia rufa TaxID=165716 RepID=A0A7J0F379_9ERIC|nr:AMP-dependent synthetase and ligase family protein [Actinidia rufa]